jgi:hypothetical protein
MTDSRSERVPGVRLLPGRAGTAERRDLRAHGGERAAEILELVPGQVEPDVQLAAPEARQPALDHVDRPQHPLRQQHRDERRHDDRADDGPDGPHRARPRVPGARAPSRRRCGSRQTLRRRAAPECRTSNVRSSYTASTCEGTALDDTSTRSACTAILPPLRRGSCARRPRPPDPPARRTVRSARFSLLCSVFRLMPRISAARVLLSRVCSSVIWISRRSASSTVVPGRVCSVTARRRRRRVSARLLRARASAAGARLDELARRPGSSRAR